MDFSRCSICARVIYPLRLGCIGPFSDETPWWDTTQNVRSAFSSHLNYTADRILQDQAGIFITARVERHSSSVSPISGQRSSGSGISSVVGLSNHDRLNFSTSFVVGTIWRDHIHGVVSKTIASMA